jgi:hypothetical protein
MVSYDGTSFPSVYPYVDFVDKKFVYNANTLRYENSPDGIVQNPAAEIWHWVVNPAVGRSWEGDTDTVKLQNFFEKTHSFYTRSWKFSKSNIPPRVFYYDGYNESRSVDMRSLFQYALSMKNSENIAYKRFTKYLLKDINTTLLQFDSANADPDESSFLAWLWISPGQNGFDDATISSMPDIQTREPIMNFLKDFKSIINEKTLGDINLFVHNAGRYNSGSIVRTDISAISMTLMDIVARSTIKEANTALQNAIDKTLIDGKMIKKIPLFDSIESSFAVPLWSATWSLKAYHNYILWNKTETIVSPNQCTLARGSLSGSSDFWRGVLVEANVWYDVTTSMAHAEKLKQDTEELIALQRNNSYACFDVATWKAKLNSYWWGNSILRISGSDTSDSVLNQPPGGTLLKWFSEPIFSLGWMKETNRFSPPSVSDCLNKNNQYLLRSPYKYTYTYDQGESSSYSCTTWFPTEWTKSSGLCQNDIGNRVPKYSCLTEHEIVNDIPSFSQAVADYSSRTCYAWDLILDGAKIKTATRTCISTTGWEDSREIDTTTYENKRFHTIPGFIRHISPTDDEISAALNNGVTPSLPIDLQRYIEFLTPKGNIVKLSYPNLFDAPIDSVNSVRLWLKNISDSEWKNIIDKENSTTIPSLEISANTFLDLGSLPTNPIDWNNYISDDLIIQVIQARNWLTPDVTTKYKKAIETTLSYSREYVSGSLLNPPKIPNPASSYEIAYLGLTPFIPSSEDNADIKSTKNEYDTRLAEIQAFNFSDPYDSAIQNGSSNAKCWPIDGVDLFQWPGALMCWLNSLKSLNLFKPGSCGPASIGFDTTSTLPISSPSISSNSWEITSFYSSWSLVWNFPRITLAKNDTIEGSFSYVKDGNVLTLPSGTTIEVKLISWITRDGSNIAPSLLSTYVRPIAQSIPVSSTSTKIAFSSYEKLGSISAKAVISIPLPNGQIYQVSSKEIPFTITDEYISLQFMQADTPLSSLDVTKNLPVRLSWTLETSSWSKGLPKYPLSLSIYDEISWILIGSGIILTGTGDAIPKKFLGTVWVYRFVVSDASDRFGESTLSIVSWPLSKITFEPISSQVLKGSNTLAFINLKDTSWNPISPDLHSLDIEVSGWYIIDTTEQKLTKMHIDATEPTIPLLFGADESGEMQVKITSDWSVRAEGKLSVLSSARLILSRVNTPIVWSDPIPMTLRLVDRDGNILVGFNSVAFLSIPSNAWYFNTDKISIRDGKSEGFLFTPWTEAGTHFISATVPGIWDIKDIPFTLDPGPSMYMTHRELDNTLEFNLRDRFWNKTNENFSTTVRFNNENAWTTSFSSGSLILPKKGGYYMVNTPDILNNTIKYSDENGSHSISGIGKYVAFIKSSRERFDFLSDYNARYTVLAWDSYLREAEDILYNTSPLNSQSLAVTTLLDNPYTEETLFRISPNGWYTIGLSETAQVETSISLANGIPTLNVSDIIWHTLIGKFSYSLHDASLSVCTRSSDSLSDDCFKSSKNNSLKVILPDSSYSSNILNWVITISSDSKELFHVNSDGRISITRSWISLVPNNDASKDALILDIKVGNNTLASIMYSMDKNISLRKDSVWGTSAIIFDSQTGMTPVRFSESSFASDVYGYIFYAPSTEKVFDDKKNGPNTIDSFGALDDTPGVGWQWKNRTLLSYAAGDTVGEATKWFHTYTMVNLWDPVAHVDKDAPWVQKEGIDRTIGTQITSPWTSVVSYSLKDLNADWYDDVTVLDTAWYVSLFLNHAGTFREKQKIAYLPSSINQNLSFWNFTGDGYSDMFSLNSSGSFVFLSNDRRRFINTDIRVQTWSSVPNGITDMRIYDMNADKKDDIVYLTEDGELGILYWTITHGIFEKSILDTTLWVYLSSESTAIWWALRTSDVKNISLNPIWITQPNSETPDSAMLNAEVYYQYNYPRSITPISSYDPSDLNWLLSTTPESSSDGNQSDTYIKSEYAESIWVRIKRSFLPIISSRPVHAGDTVRATIAFENISGKTIKDVEYLDTLPSIFDHEETKVYTLTVDGNSREIPFSYLSSDEYDSHFNLGDIPAWKTLTLSYDVKSYRVKYGDLIVWNLEKWEVGDDIYWDVGFNGSNSCGADMILWRSQLEKGYKRWTRTFSKPTVPTDLASYTADADRNGIPDRIDSMTIEQQKELYNNKTSSTPDKSVVRVNTNWDGKSLNIGFDPSTEKELSTIAENLASWLSCWFGWGGCMSFPMNWAPLAPWSAPVVFGYPLSSLVPSTGTPIFSALTCQLINIPCWTATCTLWVPFVYPASKMWANTYWVAPWGWNGMACGNVARVNWAWWQFWVDSQMNFLRVYATPTLTLGYGTAVCFGATARTYGNNPWKWVWPLTQWWNCIVMTGSLPMCKEDGSKEDGDVTWFSGLWSIKDSWNANSCSINNSVLTKDEDTWLTNDIIAYLKDPKTRELNQIYSRLSARGPRAVNLGTFIRMGWSSSGWSQVGIDIDSAKPISTGNIVKVKNKRVSGFPDFIMDWVQRQGDEAVTALFTPPTLTVIPPTTLGPNSPFDGIDSFLDKFKESSLKQSAEDLKKQMGDAYDKWSKNTTSNIQKKTLDSRTQTTWGWSNAVKGAQGDYEKWLDNNLLWNENIASTLNAGWGALSSARAAYTFVSKIPFFSIQKTRVPINVPWILPQELDRYTRTLESYKREYDTMMKDFCQGKTPEQCADAKAALNAWSFLSSIDQNIKRINDWKNFPTKLQKYVTWKQRYINQLLCYINTVQQVSGGWLKSNGVRFRKWAELVVLMRAVADWWQPFIDIFKNTNAQCGVCRNERYNAQYFKFKLLSAIIPSAPIIRFPRWPNIILNLSDIRMAMNIKVPDFQFNLTPIRLPNLPNITLPRSPKAGLSLPALALIPTIPPLPDLPDLPSIPSFRLPDLPPPPKLPKIFGSVSTMLNVMKLVSKLYCYYQKTTLVPEWNVGDVIAQRTERKWTSPMDFLNIQLPQFSVPTVKAIKVATHINAQIRSDFIAEYAKNAVRPINTLSTDFQNILPKKIGEDINIWTPAPNINIKLQTDWNTKVQSYESTHAETLFTAFLDTSFKALESEKDVLIDIDEFKDLLHSEYKKNSLVSTLWVRLDKELQKVKLEEQKLTSLLLQENNEKFELLRAYFEAEYKETSELQEKVDLLQKRENFLATNIDMRKELVADTNSESQSDILLHKYTKKFWSISYISDTPTLPQEKIGFQKYFALNTWNTSSVSSSPSFQPTSLYSPNFQGIYILTPSGEQTRLFDYIDPLLWEEHVETIDIDKDGDNDYVFILDGTLYIKSSHANTPQKNNDATIIQTKLGPSDEKPTAPNYFRENVNTPASLNITFASANPLETEWRMSFYDRYTEWDALSLGSHNSIDTPLRIVDLMAWESASSSINPLINRIPVNRSLQRVSDKSDFTLLGPKFITLTGAVDFTLSPWRTLYTGNDKIRINYNGSSQSWSLVLEPYSGYRFNEVVRIAQESWISYILWDNTSSVYYEYSDTMIGMPLLPWVKISSKNSSFLVSNHTHNESIDVPEWTEYFIEYLGDRAPIYNFDMSYPNWYYSARIQNLTDRENVLAAVSLLAPLASSDVSAPVVDFPDTISIPVYQKKTFSLKDFVFDTNPYTVTIDSDTSLDENNNWVYDDDFGQATTGATIEGNNISFGSFDSLSKKQMLLRVQDAYGNITLKNLTVSVYSPLPQILEVSGTGWVRGALADEKLSLEPIHLFRIRTGQDISLLSSWSILTDIDGYFMSGSYFTLSGVAISSRSGSFTLSEKGIPKVLPSGYQWVVSFANAFAPMTIRVQDGLWRDVYTQMLSLPNDAKIELLSSRERESSRSSIGISLENWYKAVPAALSDPNIPLGMYIISENDSRSIVLVSKDGNIYQASSWTTLNLSSGSSDYPVFTVSKDGKKVASFSYRFDFFYTTK